MDDGRLKVIIAGAGIAGLATAIALRQLPFVDVELYERFPELGEIGASIALSPNVSMTSLVSDASVADTLLGHAHLGASRCTQCSRRRSCFSRSICHTNDIQALENR